MSGRLVKLGDLLAKEYGAADFWREFGEFYRDIREHERREWLTYDEWRVILRRARDAGLLAVYATEKGEALPVFASPFGTAFLRLYRGLKDANARGISAEQFHREFSVQIDADSAAIRQAMAYRDERRREAQKPPARATTRRRSRQAKDNDESEIREVRVGYQPEKEETA